MSALTETELVEAVRQGRREGQTEMVSRYAERVFAMIARQVPDIPCSTRTTSTRRSRSMRKTSTRHLR